MTGHASGPFFYFPLRLFQINQIRCPYEGLQRFMEIKDPGRILFSVDLVFVQIAHHLAQHVFTAVQSIKFKKGAEHFKRIIYFIGGPEIRFQPDIGLFHKPFFLFYAKM